MISGVILRGWRFFIVCVVASALFACGDSGSRDGQFKGQTTLSGSVQKGPFTSLQVNAIAIDRVTGVEDSPVAAVIVDGQYRVDVPSDKAVRLEASGVFKDELTGNEVTLKQPLEALVMEPANDTSINVNLLTHLVAKQTLARQAAGQPLLSAFNAAQTFVRATLNLPATTEVVDLDLLNIRSNSDLNDPNLQLLLFSAAVLNEWPAAEGEVFGNGFFDAFVPEFAALDNGTEAVQQLSPFMGLNAQALYGQILDANVLTGLPAADDIALPDDAVLTCTTDKGCSWEDNASPTISVAAQSVFEAQGQAMVRIRLSSSSNQPLEVNLQTEQANAREFEDYVPLQTRITIPAGQREVGIPLAILLDDVTENNERFSVQISSSAADYQVVNARATITVRDGFNATFNRGEATAVSIAALCLLDAEVPGQPDNRGCSKAVTRAVFHQGVAASARVGMQLVPACTGPLGCENLETGRDWLVALALTVGSGRSMQSVGLGTYQYAGSRVGGDADESQFQLLLNDQAKALIQYAQGQSSPLSIRARILPDNEKIVVQPAPEIFALGPAIHAEGMAVQLAASGWNLVAADSPGAVACEAGEQQLTGGFSFGGDVVNQSSICISSNSAGDWVLRSGSVDLAGDELPLPAFHGMFLRLGESRLVPRGGRNLLVPVPGVDIRHLPLAAGLLVDKSNLYPGLVVSGNNTNPAEEDEISVSIFIHRDGLPVAFKVQSAELGPDGVAISYSDAVYMQEGFASADNRGGTDLASNDIWYRGIASGGVLQLTGDGLEGLIHIDANQGRLAFPQFVFSVNQPFQQPLVAGLPSGKTSVDALVGVGVFAGCVDKRCTEQSNNSQLLTGDLQLDGRGAALSTLTNSQLSRVSWGNHGNGDFAYLLEGHLAAGDTATLALPGFWFDGVNTDAVSHSLLGHLQATGDTGFTLHPSTSDQAQLGNFWPMGLSIGPEYYVDVNGSVVVASGNDIGGSIMLMKSVNANGFDENRFALRSASKYVLRHSGLTGVFNVDADTLLTPKTFSGFDISFERFGFRLRDNGHDEYSFIDGGLNVPGDAALDLVFESLALHCDASLGAANLVVSDCESAADNANCDHSLASWKAAIDIFGMGFERSGASQCDARDQTLGLDHLMAMRALSDPLEVSSGWNSLGELQAGSSVFAGGDYRLEVPGNNRRGGFALRPRGGELSVRDVSGQRYGDVSLANSLLVPYFWDALSADVRLVNRTLDTAEASVVVPAGVLSRVNLATTNQSLQSNITSNRTLDFRANYAWGGTGFGINLPVYFSPADFNDNDRPQFIGRYQKTDLMVMEAGAGVNVITPEDTDLSFGVSANVQQVASSPFRFDLNSGDSLSALDNFLVGARLLDAPVFDASFSTLRTLFTGLADFSGVGVETLISTSLHQLSDQLLAEQSDSHYFERYANDYSTVANFAVNTQASMDVLLREPVAQLKQGMQFLPAQVNDLQVDLESGLDLPALRLVEGSVVEIRQQLMSVQRGVNQLRVNIQEPRFLSRADIDALGSAMQNIVNSGNYIDNFFTELTTVNSELCNLDVAVDYSQVDVSEGSYLTTLFHQFGRMQAIAQQLAQSAALIESVEGIAQGDQQIIASLHAAARRAQLQSTQLNALIDSVSTAVIGAACSEQNDQGNNLLAEVTAFTAEQQLLVQLLFQQISNGNLQGITATLQAQPLQGLVDLSDRLLAIDTGLVWLQQTLLSQRLRADTQNPAAIVIDATQGQALLADFSRVLHEASDGAVNGISADYRVGAGDQYLFVSVNGGLNDFETLYQQVVDQYRADVGIEFPGAQLSGTQLQHLLINKVLKGGAVASLRNDVSLALADVNGALTDLNMILSDAINRAITRALIPADEGINQLFADANAGLKSLPVQAASIDGSATIMGGQLSRIHIMADWELASGVGQPTRFAASFEALAGARAKEATGCSYAPGQNPLLVRINAQSSPVNILGSDISLDQLMLGFEMINEGDALAPESVIGALALSGEMGFSGFSLNDFSLTAAVGGRQNYFGASGSAIFAQEPMEAAFFMGSSCTADPLLNLDSDAKKYVTVPEDGFSGIYTRAAASIPLQNNGCGFRISATAKMGAWLIDSNVGGLFGGGLFGTVACVGSVRGSAESALELLGGGKVRYLGSGFAVAGAGDCEPGRWTSKSRSRRDRWCGTADASFDVEYSDGEVSTSNVNVSAIH